VILEWQQECDRDGGFSVRKKYRRCSIAIIIITGASGAHSGGPDSQFGGLRQNPSNADAGFTELRAGGP